MADVFAIGDLDSAEPTATVRVDTREVKRFFNCWDVSRPKEHASAHVDLVAPPLRIADLDPFIFQKKMREKIAAVDAKRTRPTFEFPQLLYQRPKETVQQRWHLRSRNKKRDEKVFFEDSYGEAKAVDEEDRPMVVRITKEDELDNQLSDQTEASERRSILTS
jgi:hypothetical protein